MIFISFFSRHRITLLNINIYYINIIIYNNIYKKKIYIIYILKKHQITIKKKINQSSINIPKKKIEFYTQYKKRSIFVLFNNTKIYKNVILL